MNYFFSAWFSDRALLVKNDQQWKTFRMIYNMTMFWKRIFSIITSDDVITFCIWRGILFFLRFEAIVFYKKWSVHKEQPHVISFKHVWNKHFCGDRKLWRHRYVDNGLPRKMWWDGFQNCFTYWWFWDNKKWNYPDCQIVTVFSLSIYYMGCA